VVTFCLVFVILSIYWFSIFISNHNSRCLEHLLAGDDSCEITSCTFNNQRQTIIVNDVDALNYLNICFRKASKEGHLPRHNSGCMYEADLNLTHGHSCRIICNVPDKEDGLIVGCYESFDDPIYYWVTLENPIPPKIVILLSSLRGPPK
jgi:hypothetical protein